MRLGFLATAEGGARSLATCRVLWPNALVGVTDTLVVFVRYPRPGSVKTRLAATIGSENGLWPRKTNLQQKRLGAFRTQALLCEEVYMDPDKTYSVRIPISAAEVQS